MSKSEKAIYERLSVETMDALSDEICALFATRGVTRFQALDVMTTMLVFVMRDLWQGEEYRDAAATLHENLLSLNALCEKLSQSMRH